MTRTDPLVFLSVKIHFSITTGRAIGKTLGIAQHSCKGKCPCGLKFAIFPASKSGRDRIPLLDEVRDGFQLHRKASHAAANFAWDRSDRRRMDAFAYLSAIAYGRSASLCAAKWRGLRRRSCSGSHPVRKSADRVRETFRKSDTVQRPGRKRCRAK